MIYYDGDPGIYSGMIGRTVPDSDTYDQDAQMCVAVPAGSSPANVFFILGYRSPTQFWYAGLDYQGGLSGSGAGLVIGFINGGLPVTDAFLPLSALTLGEQVLLELEVVKSGGNLGITVQMDEDPASILTTTTTTTFLKDRPLGLGTYGSKVEVYNFGIGSCPGLGCG